MPNIAICGDAVVVEVAGGATFQGHKVDGSLTGTWQDTRSFGDPVFGSGIVCAWTGEVVISSYGPVPAALPPTEPGVQETATVTIVSTNSSWSLPCVLMDIKRPVDAKSLEEWQTTYRVVGAPTITNG